MDISEKISDLRYILKSNIAVSKGRLLNSLKTSVEDFRQPWKIQHLSTDIIFITVAVVICGAKDWEDIEDFGDCKEAFFNKYLALPNGIPSHDTFNRFFSSIKPKVLEQQFGIWVKSLCSERSEIISIDGKTICVAMNEGRSIFHMVSAFPSSPYLSTKLFITLLIMLLVTSQRASSYHFYQQICS
ncbi:MAG: ISAs1 family transposase [Rikenellaceae bacterium]